MKEMELKNWNNTTILEYIQIMDILKSNLGEVQKLNGIIAILTGLTEEELVSKIDYKKYQTLLGSLDFLKDKPTSQLKPEYEINGVIYKVFYNMNKISTAQYIDLLTLTKKEDEFLPNLHKVLSLFLIPTKEKKTIFGKRNVPLKYGSYDVEEVADILLNNLTIDIANELMVFFYRSFESLMKATLRYMIRQLKKMKNVKKLPMDLKQKLMSITPDGDGLQQLIELHKELIVRGIKFGK